MKKVISTTIILSLLLSLFTFTVSANNNETVNVLINKSINFEFMDEEFIPYDSSINAIVYPITYKDRTYIPARFLAEAIGFEVTWDAATQTVGFNDGGVEKVNEAKHGDRTSHNDTALLNKNIKFTVNGEPFVPTETDGSICYPLTYKDRTYIPARFIAEKAGLSVNWDGATQTIKLDYSDTYEEVEVEVEVEVVVPPTQPTTPVEPTTPTEPQKPAEETKPEDLELGRDGFEVWFVKRTIGVVAYDYEHMDSYKLFAIPGAQELIGESLTFVEYPPMNTLVEEIKFENNPRWIDISSGLFRFGVNSDWHQKSLLEMKFTGNITKYKEAITKHVYNGEYGVAEGSKDGKDYLLVSQHLVFEFDLANNTMNLIVCDAESWNAILRQVV